MGVGPRGYPGSKGLTGVTGNEGNVGIAGVGATVVDNGDGTFTITGANGSIVLSNGNSPTKGTDFFDGNTGDWVSFVYAKVPTGDAAPTIDAGTGTFDGLLETMPTGSVTWFDEPSYEVGFTTYVSSNRYKHDITTGGSGTWSLRTNAWTTPSIFTDAIRIQNQFISYAFTRSVSVPSVPAGGTFLSPVPTTAGWTDGIPVGTTPVYMVKRLFTDDGLTPQDVVWSTPQLLGESGSGAKFQFGPTNTGPWDDIPNATDEWMIACTQDSSGAYICDTANPIKIKGEVGVTSQTSFKAYAFKRAVGTLIETPTGGSFASPIPVDGVVTGWTSSIPGGTANLYVSTRLFTTDGFAPQEANWSSSQLFSGEGAINFVVTADAQVFSFDTVDANPNPTQITFTANRQNINLAPDWTTVPVIAIAADVTEVDTLIITAAEFGANLSLAVTATSGAYSDTVTIVRVKDGAAGSAGVATEIREVRFEFAPDAAGSPGTWHTSPMIGTDVWLREGTFYDDVLQGSWSAGTQIVGDDGADTFTEFWFGDVTATGDPDSDPGDWSATQGASDVYVISRTTTAGVAGSWGAIVLIRGDDGVDGKYFETRFLKGSLALGAPVNPTDYDMTAQIPAGWVTNPNIALTGDEVIWAITATKNADGTLDTNWSAAAVQWGAYTPVRGTDYNDGVGIFRSKVYKEAADGYNTPPTVNTGSWDGVTEVLPSGGGWSDDPLTPAAGNFIYESTYLYVATLVAGVSTWPATAGTWSAPAKYTYIPVLGTDYNNGVDGDGTFLSYVFNNEVIGTDISGTPPTGGTYTGPGTETLPAGWTDDPVSPPAGEVTWVSVRTYVVVAGVWQSPPAWSDPSEFSAITSLVGVLTNDADSVASDFNGNNIVYNGDEGGNFLVYFGITDVTSSTAFTVAGGANSGSNHILAQNGLTMSINRTTGLYTLTGAGWSSDKETFTLVGVHTASGATTTKKYTLVKAKNGDVGISGTANRLDLAYGTSGSGGSVNYPTSGPASSTGKAYLGTNIVTWIPPATEPAVSTTAGDYEWTQFVGDDGTDGSNGEAGSIALNSGRRANDLSLWWGNSTQLTNLTTPWSIQAVAGPIWPNVIQGVDNSGDSNDIYSERIAVVSGQKYRVSVEGQQPSGDRTNYLFVRFYDSAGDGITSSSSPVSDATGWPSSGTNHYWGVINNVFSTTWTRYEIEFGGDATPTIPTNAATMAIGGFFLRAGTVSTTLELQDFNIVEVAASGVDGTPAVNTRYPTIYRKNSSSIVTGNGTYADPLNGNASWSFAIPAITTDGDIIYASTRILTSDGNSPQEANWVTPVVYATRVDGSTVVGPDGQSGRTVNLYKKNDSTLTSNTTGNFANPISGIEAGWGYAVPALSANNDIIYVIVRTFTSDGAAPQDSTWTAPVIYSTRTDGSNGSPGSDGLSSRVDFAYSDNDNGSGNLRLPTGLQSTTYTPATTLPSSNYIGTNVVTWSSELAETPVSSTVGDYEWTRFVGQDGTDALTVLNYAQSIALPANGLNVVSSYANSGNTIQIYEGETQLTYNGAGTTPGTWDITSIDDVNITAGAISAVSNNAQFANASSMSSAQPTGFITSVINGERLNGDAFTAQTTQTFTKVSQILPAVTASMTNSNHTIPMNVNGAAGDYTGSGTEITVFQGITELVYDAVGTANSSWRVSAVDVDIQVGTFTPIIGSGVSIGAANTFTSGATPLIASITFTLDGIDAGGNAFSIVLVQSFSKSLATPAAAPNAEFSQGATLSVSDTSNTPANAIIDVFMETDGTLTSLADGGFRITRGNWLDDLTGLNTSLWECRATLAGGTNPNRGNAIGGSYLPMTSERTWGNIATVVGTITSTIVIEIREIADTGNTDSITIDLIAQETNEGS